MISCMNLVSALVVLYNNAKLVSTERVKLQSHLSCYILKEALQVPCLTLAFWTIILNQRKEVDFYS